MGQNPKKAVAIRITPKANSQGLKEFSIKNIAIKAIKPIKARTSLLVEEMLDLIARSILIQPNNLSFLSLFAGT